MKILVLGERGMLGRAVHTYFTTSTDHTVLTHPVRWGEDGFATEIQTLDPEVIINCIGKIPQKKPVLESEYTDLNVILPRFLDTLGIKIVHPSTDCEFKGDIPPGTAYTKQDPRDADDAYGMSKALISKELEDTGKHTKIIRTSIIGHEAGTALSLLDWFLSQSGTVRGYTNHYWNGITTLEWAKQCEQLLHNWDTAPRLTQLGTSTYHSKYEVLSLAGAAYDKSVVIEPFETEITVNKCLLPDYELRSLPEQLAELRDFFTR